MKKICLFLIVGLVCSLGAQAVTITVSGGGAVLQAAIDGANAGDVIEITDSLVYNEDIFIGVGGGGAGKDGISIIGTAVNPPTILATNSSIHSGASPDVAGRGIVGGILGVASALLAAGNPLPDQLGMLVEASNCTFTNLIIQNDGPSVSSDLFTGACTVVGDDNTFNDCTFNGGDRNDPGITDNEFCISFTSGNWPELDTALAFVGLTDYFLNLGYTTAVAAERTTLNNCVFSRGTNSLGSGDYSQFFFNAITAGYLNAVVPFNIVFNDCSWVSAGDGEVIETGGTDNLVFNNCLFDGNQGVLDVGGGTWVFNDTVFANSTDERLFRHDAIVEFGGGAPQTSFSNCLFCGNSPNEDRIIEIQEGGASFSRCIFNATEDSIMLWDYNNWDGQFLDGSFYPGTAQVVSFDRCDFYRPNGTSAVVRLTGDDTPDAPQPGASLVITNSIITGTDIGVQITGPNLPPGGADLTIDNNDYLGTTLLDNQLGWTETSVANNLANVAPGYANAGGCTAADYAYGNSALTTAGTTGGPIGSQDPPAPPGQNVEKWEIYQ